MLEKIIPNLIHNNSRRYSDKFGKFWLSKPIAPEASTWELKQVGELPETGMAKHIKGMTLTIAVINCFFI